MNNSDSIREPMKRADGDWAFAQSPFPFAGKKSPELLAPAGSVTGLKAVISAGADAVYIGADRFGARAYADLPDQDELLEAIDHAHLRKVAVYLTVNTLFKENELRELPDFLLPYYERGIDAVLVQDLGALRLLHREFPDLPLHASTQMTQGGPEGILLLKKYGVQRVVLPRELSLFEIREIGEKTDMPLEVFVHGALCYCYSGQCLMSSMLGGRSGNRGRCAQPCRLPYDFSGSGGTLLSMKDLCALPILPDILSAGPVSLKIEGRMKRPEYAAGVVSIYRKYLDLLIKDPDTEYRVDPEDLEMLKDLFQRDGFTEGYFSTSPGPSMISKSGEEMRRSSKDLSSLYDSLKKEYIDKEKEIPVRAELRIKKDEPIGLTLCSDDCVVKTEGPVPERAMKRAATKDEVLRPVEMTGGSGITITKTAVELDPDLFVPASALKTLRRDAVDALKANILSEFRRTQKASAAAKIPDCTVCRIREDKEPVFTFTVQTADQMEALLKDPIAERIGLPADPVFSERLSEIRAAGKSAILVMPWLFRPIKKEWRSMLTGLLKMPFDGVLLRSLETLSLVREVRPDLPVRADANLYAWNSEARQFLAEEGISSITVPYELNRHEVREQEVCDREFILYGRVPLMISAQDLFMNTDAGKTESAGLLTDRKGAHFYVRKDARFCYNMIYNSVPTDLTGIPGEIMDAGLRTFRIDLTDEDPKAVREILQKVRDFADRKERRIAEKHTKGHWMRGVE